MGESCNGTHGVAEALPQRFVETGGTGTGASPLTAMGDLAMALASVAPGDAVEVSRAPFSARLLSVGGPNFYQKLRARWHYGERLQG